MIEKTYNCEKFTPHKSKKDKIKDNEMLFWLFELNEFLGNPNIHKDELGFSILQTQTTIFTPGIINTELKNLFEEGLLFEKDYEDFIDKFLKLPK